MLKLTADTGADAAACAIAAVLTSAPAMARMALFVLRIVKVGGLAACDNQQQVVRKKI
jgi:hypothetical protein